MHHFKYMPVPSGLQSFCKSADSLLRVPLYVTCCFSLATFNILSLSLIFAILITMCFDVVLFGLIMFGTLCFLDLDACFFSQIREVFSYYVFKYVLCPFLSLFAFWDPFYVSVTTLMFSQKSLKLSSFLFILFSVQLQWFPLLHFPASWTVSL